MGRRRSFRLFDFCSERCMSSCPIFTCYGLEISVNISSVVLSDPWLAQGYSDSSCLHLYLHRAMKRARELAESVSSLRQTPTSTIPLPLRPHTYAHLSPASVRLGCIYCFSTVLQGYCDIPYCGNREQSQSVFNPHFHNPQIH
jgi:hypothetical protein